MNSINQSAVRTTPRHSGICRGTDSPYEQMFIFLAAQKKPSSRHICNMPYAPSQGNAPGNETNGAAADYWEVPADGAPGDSIPSNRRALLPESPALASLAAGVLWHSVLQALTHSGCVCVTASVRKANEVMIHSLGSFLAILTALWRITCTCGPPETPGHTCTGFLYLLWVLPAWWTMKRRRAMRTIGLLAVVLFTAPLVILVVHTWPTKIDANDTCHWKVRCSVIIEWLLFLLKPLSCGVLNQPF